MPRGRSRALPAAQAGGNGPATQGTKPEPVAETVPDFVSGREFKQIVEVLAELMGDLAARVTNVETVTRLRHDARQGPDGLDFPGRFSKAAYEAIKHRVGLQVRRGELTDDNAGKAS